MGTRCCELSAPLPKFAAAHGAAKLFSICLSSASPGIAWPLHFKFASYTYGPCESILVLAAWTGLKTLLSPYSFLAGKADLSGCMTMMGVVKARIWFWTQPPSCSFVDALRGNKTIWRCLSMSLKFDPDIY